MLPRDPTTGVLLVGHGTRSERGRRQFLHLAEGLAADLAPLVAEPAFLELASPGIDEGVGRLLEHRLERLLIMPLLLFAAGHAKDDVPRAVSQALARRGLESIDCIQANHLGCHPALLELSRLRMAEGVEQSAAKLSEGVDLPRDGARVHLLVGRGSRDDEATAEMQRYAQLSAERTGWRTEVAFLAMARPLLQEQLAALAASRPAAVVVQPHLLFHGELIEQLHQEIEAMRWNFPATNWQVTSLLADEPGVAGVGTELLSNAIASRLGEAVIRVVAIRGDD